MAQPMTNLTPEIIESATDERLAELVAVHCMGWQKSNTKPYDEGCTAFQFWMNGDETLFLEHHWQPHLPTEKGKAQCWDLMLKLNMAVDVENESVMGPGWAGDCASVHGKVTQDGFLRACLYSVIGKE